MVLPAERRTRLTTFLAVAALLSASAGLGPWVPTAAAESKIARVTKNALYGAGLGLLLGSVTALVVDKNSRDDSIRWGIVLGTFAGFGYGVYAVASGSDDDFFLASASASSAEPGFDPRNSFVGTPGRWIAEQDDDAVTRSSGLFTDRDPFPDHSHVPATQLVTE